MMLKTLTRNSARKTYQYVVHAHTVARHVTTAERSSGLRLPERMQPFEMLKDFALSIIQISLERGETIGKRRESRVAAPTRHQY
jgi:hypothetical protein